MLNVPLKKILLSSVGVLMLSSAPVMAQPVGTVGEYSDAVVEGSILEPKPIVVNDDAELAKLIKVPAGFEVEIAGRSMGHPRMLAVHGEHVYATRRMEGDVIRLDDADGDGKFEGFTTVAARPGMHGIAFDGSTVFLITVKDVYTAPVNDDGSFGELTRIIADLPDAGQHANRTLGIGPDGMLYITVGSTCNECIEPNPENATILRSTKDGKTRTIFASGLRNTIGFGWEPTTGALFGADHGIDWLGDEEQQEELNLVEQGKKYGWPFIYDFSNPNPHMNPPEGVTLEQWAKDSQEPLLGYTPHSAPMQMSFYNGDAFPAEYRGDAFVAMRGSWNRRPPSGYEISRVDFQDGKPAKWEHFAEGLLIKDEADGYGFLGRLSGVVQGPDGSLLFGDDFNGIVYRVTYKGDDTTEAASQPATPPNVVVAPTPSDIAINLVESDEALEVTSSSFAAGEMLSIAQSAEGHNASPALSWSAGPEGTKSYVIIADDPDAKEPKPFVHWVLFDVASDITSVREGLAIDVVLAEPEGAKQGTNSRGQTGYYGPRPPLNDPAHNYHFQIFAVDLATLPVEPGAKREDVLAAIDGHVLAKGEIVGQFKRPADEKPAS